MAEPLQTFTRNRLMEEMLGKVNDGDWSVLVMDPEATRIMSAACRVSEILNYGVALVDDLFKVREPQTNAAGVYFITPSEASVRRVIQDWAGRPTYGTAHIFFTSKVPPQLLGAIKGCPGLIARLKTLAEVNVEYLQLDSRSFVTGEDRALALLFGAASDENIEARVAVKRIAQRLATLFATLKEMPSIRFRTPKPPDMDSDEAPVLEARSLVSQRIAAELDAILAGYQASGLLPQAETCELVIMDRGFDPVAPIIHDWTYEPMVYDLLEPEGATYRYQAENNRGQLEEKQHVLNEKDSMWVDLRHKHFADAINDISQQMNEFTTKNAAARHRPADGGQLDVRDMRRLVQALPQYRRALAFLQEVDQLAKLSVHVEIASELNRQIDERRLTDLGKLEQDVVFGDVTSKEVLAYFTMHGASMAWEDKARLFMCYVATHPEKLDESRADQWRKVTRLTPAQFAAVTNLEFLGVPVFKRNRAGGLFFGRKRKRNVRKDRGGEEGEEQWVLSRFYPLLQDVLEDVIAGRLSDEEYPYVRHPPPATSQNSVAATESSFSARPGSFSVRSRPAWAKRAQSSAAAALSAANGDPLSASFSGRGPGKRILTFVVGGISRSELRVAHALAARTGRDITIGSTSIETPASFLQRVQELSGEGVADITQGVGSLRW